MLHEFCLLTGVEENSFKEKWSRCQDRIMKYAPLEKKKAVQDLLRDINAIENECEGTCMPCVPTTLYMCMHVYAIYM